VRVREECQSSARPSASLDQHPTVIRLWSPPRLGEVLGYDVGPDCDDLDRVRPTYQEGADSIKCSADPRKSLRANVFDSTLSHPLTPTGKRCGGRQPSVRTHPRPTLLPHEGVCEKHWQITTSDRGLSHALIPYMRCEVYPRHTLFSRVGIKPPNAYRVSQDTRIHILEFV
jgi:hypothetical protein